MKRRFKGEDTQEWLNRSHKMEKEEIHEYFTKVRHSHRVQKDKSKFDRKKSRQEKQKSKGWE